MRRLLRYANFAKVANALGVSRASVAEWAKGHNVSPYRLQQIESLLIPGHDESAPAGAEALATKTAV
jgi:DNA-binding transcriptional regulator YdaS (Cro superfamily)